MAYTEHTNYRGKKERIGLKVRYYIQRVKNSIHRRTSKIRGNQDVVKPLNQTQSDQSDDRSYYQQKVLGCKQGRNNSENYVKYGKNKNQNERAYNSWKNVSIPVSLQLFDNESMTIKNELPPFLHFGPMKDIQATERSIGAASSTNCSSIMSSEFLTSTIPTEPRSLFPMVNNHWEIHFQGKGRLFLPKKRSLDDIDEIVELKESKELNL